MAVSLVGGAAIGAVFQELLSGVIDAGKRAAKFPDRSKDLESMLSKLEPYVNQIDSLNKELDQGHETKDLRELISKGLKLARRCSKIQRWDLVRRSYYTYKLDGFNRSFERFCQTIMPIEHARDVKEMRVEIKRIDTMITRLSLKEGSGCSSGIFSQVPVVRSFKVPEPLGKVVGFDVPLKELKMKLLKDGVSVIVVSAPGGYGKTTLVKELCRDEDIKEKFKDNIFYIIVSKTPNMKVILQKLLQLKDSRMPEFLEAEALNELEQNFRQMGTNPILLILDDVWPGFESLVEKFKFSLPDYKILVTSRVDFRRLDFTIRLKSLNDDDAMTLFRQFAFMENEEHYIPDNLVLKIMNSCKGLPLALEVVGKSLRRQPVAIWKKIARDLSKGVSIFGSSNDLLACLQSSLDVLDSQVGIKDYYLDLGSFPEDHRIPATALIDMWVEQYELDEDYDAGIKLHELSTINLVNLVVIRKDPIEVDGYYNEYFVVQHDLLREFAIHLSSLEPVENRKRLIVELIDNNFPAWWLEERQQPLSARLLSISTDETFSFSWGNIQAPHVEVLVLNLQTKYYTLPTFMEKMHGLKVLIVTNNGFCPAELCNFLVLCSLSNLKRIRLEKLSIASLNMSSSQLKNLQKISLVMCNIGEAFKNGTSKMSDIFPNLLEIDVDYCDDLEELTQGLCDLVKLMKLSITNCHKLRALPEGIGKLVNLEMLRLTSCTHLMTLPETIGSLSKLCILDISDCLSIVSLPNRIGELHNLWKLYMRGCSSCILPWTIRELQQLTDVICDEETAYQWEFFKPNFTNLKVTVHKEAFNLNWLHASF